MEPTATSQLDKPSAAAADAELDWPPWALARILGAPALTDADIGRVACAAPPLRAAVDAELRIRWGSVRVIGSRMWQLHQPTFKGLEAYSPPVVMEDPPGRHSRAPREPPSPAVRAYESTMLPAAAWSEPLLRATLRRCSGVHTVNFDDVNVANSISPWREEDGNPKRLKLDGALLRDICSSSWGASLRILTLGSATLTVDDVHNALAACSVLAWLDASDMRLPDGEYASLFGHNAPTHRTLRALALPYTTPVEELVELAKQACKRCPCLKELECYRDFPSEVNTDRDFRRAASVVKRAAKAARAAGVPRVLCVAMAPPYYDEAFESRTKDGSYREFRAVLTVD